MALSVPYLGFLLLPLGVFLCLRPPLALLIATILAAPWMAASVLNISFGQYTFGIQPGYYFAALYLISATVSSRAGPRQSKTVTTLQRYSVALAVWGALSAAVLPLVFAGRVLVVAPRILYVLGSPGTPLSFQNTNVSHTIYLVCVLAFFAAAVRQMSSHPRMLESCANWYTVAGILATGTALYDLLRWKYGLPSIAWLFENPQYGKSLFLATSQGEFLQRSGDYLRVSGCFPEASYFGQFEAAFFPFALYRAMKAGHKTDWLAAIISLVGLVLSVSPEAYIAGGALATVATWRAMKVGRRIHPAVLRAAAVILIGGSLFAVFYEPIMNRASTAIDQKIQTDSFAMRTTWDLIGARVFVETYGIGAGLGSNRASSLLMTILSNIGVPGALLFLGIGATLLRARKRAAAWFHGAAGPGGPNVDALVLAAAGSFGAAAIAIPDIVIINMWTTLALAAGGIAAYSTRPGFATVPPALRRHRQHGRGEEAYAPETHHRAEPAVCPARNWGRI
jgi:hypothetical protein